MNVSLESSTAPLPTRLECAALITSGYLDSESPEHPGFRREARRAADGWAADLHIARRSKVSAVASFSVDFLGCKVSHADAQAVRERLLADGHAEQDGAADVAVVNTCCVTHEAAAKSRQAASRAARTHGRVYVTGCGANLSADAFAGLPENVVVVARRSEETPAVRRRRRRRDRLRPGRGAARPRPRVRQGAGRLQLLVRFCVIPLVRGASRSRSARRPCSPRCGGASTRGTARSF